MLKYLPATWWKRWLKLINAQVSSRHGYCAGATDECRSCVMDVRLRQHARAPGARSRLAQEPARMAGMAWRARRGRGAVRRATERHPGAVRDVACTALRRR